MLDTNTLQLADLWKVYLIESQGRQLVQFDD